MPAQVSERDAEPRAEREPVSFAARGAEPVLSAWEPVQELTSTAKEDAPQARGVKMADQERSLYAGPDGVPIDPCGPCDLYVLSDPCDPYFHHCRVSSSECWDGSNSKLTR